MVSHPGWRVAQRAGTSNGAVSGLCRAANKKLGWDTARGSNKPIQNGKSVGEWLSFEVWKRWHMIMMHVIPSLQGIFCPVFKASIGVDVYIYIYCKPNVNTVNAKWTPWFSAHSSPKEQSHEWNVGLNKHKPKSTDNPVPHSYCITTPEIMNHDLAGDLQTFGTRQWGFNM